jgi:putative membrane protein
MEGVGETITDTVRNDVIFDGQQSVVGGPIMGRLLIQLVATAAALFVAIAVVPGVDLAGTDGRNITDPRALLNLLIVAAIFAVINAVVKPILKFSTCLINMLTLGLFTFVINAFLLWLTSYIADQIALGFTVDGVVPALLGSLIVSVVSTVLSIFTRGDD